MATREEEERLVGNRLPLDIYFQISQALAGADTAGENEVNALRTVMGGAANFRMPSGGLTSASVKSMMSMQDEDILSQIINLQSQADLKDEDAYRKWYTEQGLDPFFFEPAREKWRTSQKALRLELDEQHKVDVTRPADRVAAKKARLALKTAQDLDDYTQVEESATVLLNTIKDQYTTYTPGGKQLNKSQAIDKLTSGLIELGIKGKDLASYTARLESVIKLTEETRAGKVNKTAGRYATEIIRGLENETYDYVEAMAKFNELAAGLDPSSAGVKAARTALTDHISAMKYTQETLPVIMRTGDYAGTVGFVTRKQLLEDMERPWEERLYASTVGESKLPPGMSLVAWMVTDPEVPDSKKQFIPHTFIQKMAVEGYGRLWALTPEERTWWNAWVDKYKEVNPDAMDRLIQALGGGGTGGSGASFN